MTPRAMLSQVIQGQSVELKPVIDTSGSPRSAVGFEPNPDQWFLGRVDSPLAHAEDPKELLARLAVDPADAEADFDRLVSHTRSQIDQARAQEAEGIFYRLYGADPSVTTPMQYGGHLLEIDRALLEEAQGFALNVLWIDAGPEGYLDFVSDLPATIFAWDSEVTGIQPAAIRAMRSGLLASNHPDADLPFVSTPQPERASTHV